MKSINFTQEIEFGRQVESIAIRYKCVVALILWFDIINGQFVDPKKVKSLPHGVMGSWDMMQDIWRMCKSVLTCRYVWYLLWHRAWPLHRSCTKFPSHSHLTPHTWKQPDPSPSPWGPQCSGRPPVLSLHSQKKHRLRVQTVETINAVWRQRRCYQDGIRCTNIMECGDNVLRKLDAAFICGYDNNMFKCEVFIILL